MFILSFTVDPQRGTKNKAAQRQLRLCTFACFPKQELHMGDYRVDDDLRFEQQSCCRRHLKYMCIFVTCVVLVAFFVCETKRELKSNITFLNCNTTSCIIRHSSCWYFCVPLNDRNEDEVVVNAPDTKYQCVHAHNMDFALFPDRYLVNVSICIFHSTWRE